MMCSGKKFCLVKLLLRALETPALGMVLSSDSRLPDWESDALTSGAAETTGTGNEQGRDRWSWTLVARSRNVGEVIEPTT